MVIYVSTKRSYLLKQCNHNIKKTVQMINFLCLFNLKISQQLKKIFLSQLIQTFDMLIGLRTLLKESLASQLHKLSWKSRQSLWKIQIPVKFYHSTKKHHLEKIQQRGLAAFFVIEYVRQFQKEMFDGNSLTIRQRLIDKDIFSAYMISKINLQLEGDEKIQKIEQIGLEWQSIQIVLAGFQMQKGMYFDIQVFTQKRMLNSFQKNSHDILQKENVFALNNYAAKFYQKSITVLNPMVHTGRVFNVILGKQVLSNISGDKGIGKSFCYLLYNYLSYFVIQARIQDKFHNLKAGFFADFFSKNTTFYNVNKLFYIPCKQLTSQADLACKLYLQIYQPLMQKHTNLLRRSQIKQAQITECKMLYRKYNINSFFVIDQINSLYSDIRKLILKQERGQKKSQKEQQIITIKSIYFQHLARSSKLILNSSQSIECQLLKYRLKQEKFFNIYEHDEDVVPTTIIDFIQQSKSAQGLVELYGVLWFELTKLLITSGLDMTIINSLRKTFYEAFKIYPSFQNIIPWKNSIVPLDIRRSFYKDEETTLKYPQPINITKLIEKCLNGEKQQIKAQFLNIKTEIENFKKINLRNSLIIFVGKGVDDYDKRLRRSMLLQIRKEAEIYKDFPMETFEANMEGVFKMIHKIRENSPQVRLEVAQQISLSISQLRIGRYYDNKKYMNVKLSPRQFFESSNFLFQTPQKLRSIYQEIFQYNPTKLTGNFYGQALDGFSSRLFERGWLKLKLDRYFLKQNQINYQIRAQTYDIINGFQFKSINSTKSIDQSFSKLFQEARNNFTGDYVSGVADTRNNQGFDVVFIKKDHDKESFQIITLDITANQIYSKIIKIASKKKTNAGIYQQALQRFFQSIKLNKESSQFISEIIQFIENLQSNSENFKIQQIIKIVYQIRKKIDIKKHFLYGQQDKNQSIITSVMQQAERKLVASNKREILKQCFNIDIFRKEYNMKKQQNTNGKQNKTAKLFKNFQNSSNYLPIKEKFLEICYLVSIFNNCRFEKKEDMLNFIIEVCTFQKDFDLESDFKIIPQELANDDRIKRHHFYTPFRLLRKYQGKQSLKWIHVIAAPPFRIKKYLSQYDSAVKRYSQGRKTSKPTFLFNSYYQKSQDSKRQLQLSFAIAQLSFNEKMLAVLPKKSKENPQQDHLIIGEYQLIRTLTNIIEKNNKAPSK